VELSRGDSEQGGGYQQLLGHDRRVHTSGGGSNPPDDQPNAAAFGATLGSYLDEPSTPNVQAGSH
jgi:hypothetical protein